MYVSRKTFMENYLHYLDAVFCGDINGYEQVYREIAAIKPWDVIDDERLGFNSEIEAQDFVSRMVERKIEEEPKQLKAEYVSQPLKFELINEMVEISNEQGHYLHRACESVVSMSVIGNDLVVVKKNGDVEYYGNGEYLATIAHEAQYVAFDGKDVCVKTKTGDCVNITVPLKTLTLD